MKVKVGFLLFILVCFFLATRLFRISTNPPSLYWDEASIGYNAYSIGIDGKDEWGSFLSVHFRAFGEFKLPVYIYSVVPFVKIFGLDVFSVRLPSVMYSLCVVLLTYFIAKKLTSSQAVSVFSAFFIVVTPWLFIFSRTGYEATAGLAFYLLGILFTFFSFKKPLWYFFALASFMGSIYSYNSFRVLSVVLIFLSTAYLIVINRRKLSGVLAVIVISLFVFCLSMIPILRLYKYDSGGVRATTVGINGTATQKIYIFGINYLEHFSPKFLFNTGDENLRSQIPGFGQIYWISLPLMIFGIYKIYKERSLKYLAILFFMLLGPIPASLTRESPHALRSIATLPFMAIICGLGYEYVLTRFKKEKTLLLTSIPIIYLLFFEFYLTNYFNNYPKLSSKDWQYGYKQIYDRYGNTFSKYQNIYISDKYGQPYIFTLFYLKTDPEKFRSTSTLGPISNWGQSKIYELGGKYIYHINPSELNTNSIVFASDEDRLVDQDATEEIKFLDGSTAFWVYKI